MKKKILIGTGVLVILATLGFTACHHASPYSRIGWIKEEIADRLELSSAQRQQLDDIAAGMLERKKRMHQDREAIRGTLMAELKKEHIDRATIDGLVVQKRQQMDEMAEFLVGSAIALHETLTPQQKEKLVAELEKLHSRIEKYCPKRW
jgi:Spy/CpxP family protein refolding chaperone